MGNSKFFTNEPEKDLYTRFSKILQSNTQFFDILVGYFRSSGFFRMKDALVPVEKIRILVGLNVDRYTVKIIDQTKNEIAYSRTSNRDGHEMVAIELEEEFANAPEIERVEEGVRTFIDWLKSGKMEIRMFLDAPLHAKVYIVRKNQATSDTLGCVITGSSNFSEAGLQNNLEFNVELRDDDDVAFAEKKFEELWKKGVDIKDTYIDTVEHNTWLRNDITPYELYLKTLYEFFKEEINADKENFETLLPEGYMRLQYQIDAVTQAKKKLDAYGGVFISDVVGLGKTYICAMLANSFNRNTYKLIVCPPVLVDYWRSVLQEFDVSRCDVESLGKLDRIIKKGTDKYSYVFVDEAHRFRNSDTESFSLLHQICRGKKVILISATPINNYTSDIENQIYLFQSKQSGTINGIKNIEGFFRGLNSRLNAIPKGTKEYMDQLRRNSETIRDKLIREVMIRRTRGEIQEYYGDDLRKQGLTFPKTGSPEKIIYEFDDATDEAFKETIDTIKDFKYARYTPLLYLKDTTGYETLMVSQRNMGGFMKGILVKRLESSFYAFRMTLQRFIESYELFIAMAKSGDLYISKRINVYDLLDDGTADGFGFDDEHERERDRKKLEYYIEQGDVMHIPMSNIKPSLLKDLELDLAQLKYLRDLWDRIKVDPKLDEFKKNLSNNKIMLGKKIIVFTESRETAEYLCANLKDLFGKRIINFSGQSSAGLKIEIEDSFNPKFKAKENDKYDVLITTDVLAEGINLHRANVLVNYDLPWNPTRIMQRVGRVNRVGTEFDRIFVFNFFPTAQSAQHMPLEERILEKLQAFHDTLGEDSKYLSDEEIVSSQKLFADLTKDIDADEESTNPELAYLAVIRKIRDEDPSLFNKIKKLPKKAKAGKRHVDIENDSTITFIRKGALKSFFINSGSTAEQLSFMDAISFIKAESDEPAAAVASKYYSQLEKNSNAFDEMIVEEEEASSEIPMLTGNDAKIIRLLKAIKSDPRITDEEESRITILIQRWENGEIPSKISKDVVKKSKNITDSLAFYYDIMRLVPETYLQERQYKNINMNDEKQVILSCYLKAED